MNAFADAAAALHGDANLSVDATFTPKAGSAVELTVAGGTGVILTSADETHDLLGTGARRSRTRISVPRAALVARPVDGDALKVGSRRFNIRGSDPDDEGETWILDVDEQVIR